MAKGLLIFGTSLVLLYVFFRLGGEAERRIMSEEWKELRATAATKPVPAANSEEDRAELLSLGAAHRIFDVEVDLATPLAELAEQAGLGKLLWATDIKDDPMLPMDKKWNTGHWRADIHLVSYQKTIEQSASDLILLNATIRELIALSMHRATLRGTTIVALGSWKLTPVNKEGKLYPCLINGDLITYVWERDWGSRTNLLFAMREYATNERGGGIMMTKRAKICNMLGRVRLNETKERRV